MADDLTIDELARRAGTRTTTVRLYQTKGLLPPPEIRGRLGYYNAAHLARLRVIERLQKRGFSLAAIKELFESWSQGASLSTVLDPDRELAGFGEPAQLTPADFAALFPDGHIDPELMARASQLGLIAIDAERGIVRVPSKAFLAIGRELAAHNVPPARSVAEFELLARDTRAIAERFVSLFAEFVGEDADPAEPAAALEQVVERFKLMAATAVQELVLHAIDEFAAGRVSRSTVDS
jgi:DNA-binding transcriptional MerR regulator